MSEGSDQITMDTTAVDYYYEVTRGRGRQRQRPRQLAPLILRRGPGEMGTSGIMEREQRAIICGVVEGASSV